MVLQVLAISQSLYTKTLIKRVVICMMPPHLTHCQGMRWHHCFELSNGVSGVS